MAPLTFHALLVATVALLAAVKAQDPVAPPKPYFSTEKIPLAFHGANKTGMFSEADAEHFARYYQMVTIEKWYTNCASQGPTQGPPSCDVEDKMYTTFNQIKKANPNVTTIMYLNSMINFAFYHLNQIMLDREAAGKPSLLRDKNGKIVYMCNDGNVYCNVTRFDWTQPEVFAIWQEVVHNATTFGGVDGIFADHGTKMLEPPTDPKLCDGSGASAYCAYFTPKFAAEFNSKHAELVNSTQGILSASTRGPVIDGPYGKWNIDTCNFHTVRNLVEAGEKGTGPFVLEVSKGACTAATDENCLASFLAAMGNYTYLTCFTSAVPQYYNVYDKPLGIPQSKAIEGPAGVFSRNFTNAVGITRVMIDTNKNIGSVQWAGEPPPPPYSPSCGPLLTSTGMAGADIGFVITDNYPACCDACEKKDGCTIWCWHATTTECHFHTDKAAQHNVPNTYAGRLVKA